VLLLRPVSHWTAILDQHDIACDPVQTPDQVIADPQVTAMGQLESVELAGEGRALLARLPIGFSLTPAAIQGPPPVVGQHTRTILREAGYAGAEIEDLIRSGVCEAALDSQIPAGETQCKS